MRASVCVASWQVSANKFARDELSPPARTAPQMSRLLLLTCCKQKRQDAGELLAIDRYDGPAFKVVRRYLRTSHDPYLEMAVLSAAYGLIRADQPIPNYDRKMTAERARELREQIADAMSRLSVGSRYQSTFVCASKTYRSALATSSIASLAMEQPRFATGSQGMQLAQLKAWLYQGAPASSIQCHVVHSDGFRLRAYDYFVTYEQAISVARQALANGEREALRTTEWYVEVDGRRVAPKWLVSQLTGLPVSAFHSQEARRVLGELGCEVRQV